MVMTLAFARGDAPTSSSQNLPGGALAAVTLPPSLFDGITDRGLGDGVGIFFLLYKNSTLFPVRSIATDSNSTRRPAVASAIVAATVGPGLNFVDLDPEVEIILRTSNNFNEVKLINVHPQPSATYTPHCSL